VGAVTGSGGRTAVPVLDCIAGVRSVYQPIVDLADRRPVAFEALARGPAGSGLEAPLALFAAARDAGAEGLLDQSCQAAAFRGALQARLPASVPLFVNVEPRWLGLPWPDHLAAVLDRAQDRLQVVVELTERSLVADPAALVATVEQVRRHGWGVAMDDVGADPASLALLPLVDPDVVKLDLRLIQDRTTDEVAGIVNAVNAHSERSGALVLAEGIETEEHLRKALALGAHLGQGWLFGRPADLPDRMRPGRHEHAFGRAVWTDPADPWDAVRGKQSRAATKELLLPISHHLERHPLTATEPPVLLSTFEDATHFTPATARRYERLARCCSLVGAFGTGMPAEPVPGIRGADLAAGDPLGGQWVVACLGPHFAGALVAADLGDASTVPGVRDRDRRFRYVVTHDRETVVRAARSLLRRMAPLG
jgi:EAL domain-containing protein (putative c-di-GMP-specific phosphodiesterase class I)